jgi:exo-beta-1,3-glucanase (GH17 family)
VRAHACALSKPQLLDYLRDVRQLAPKDVPVTTAEVWDIWNKQPELAVSVDFVMVHFYPFWEGRPVADANESLWRNYETLKGTLRSAHPDRDVRIVIGETGWPSGGVPQGRAVAAPQNQRRYIEQFMASACARSVPFYFFQAFDENGSGKKASRPVLRRCRPTPQARVNGWGRTGVSISPTGG